MFFLTKMAGVDPSYFLEYRKINDVQSINISGQRANICSAYTEESKTSKLAVLSPSIQRP
jgi:hypothetical protein